MSQHDSRGVVLRLVDLVVVVAIFSMIAALTLPAILRVRERSNQFGCAYNLREIAIAAHKYHSDHHMFPPGWLGPNPDGPDASGSPNVGVLVALLPYLDNEDLYKQLHYQRDVLARTNPPTHPATGLPYDPPSNVPWWELTHPTTGVSNFQIAQTRIKALRCPSDDPYASQLGSILAVHLYGSDTPNAFIKPTILMYAEHAEARELGRTNYLGVAGCIGSPPPAKAQSGSMAGMLAEYHGIFGNRYQLTLGQLTAMDGASSTLMFGESCGGTSGPGADERAYAFSWFVGALPTYHGLPRGTQVPWYSFSSRHPARVHFAFGDASVRGLKRGRTAELYSDDWFVLQSLAGIRDGRY